MSDNTPPHARAFDLPGWPCPPRASQIPDHAGSYGWVFVSSIWVDEDGLLWVDSDAQVRPSGDDWAVCLAWTEDGIGLWAPRKTYGKFQSTVGNPPRALTPIARIVPEPPAREIT